MSPKLGKMKVYIGLVLAVFIFNLLTISPVIFVNLGLNKFAKIIYCYFSPLCHQIDSRSFHINGVKLAVCSRCSLIYFGALIGVLIFPIVNRHNFVKNGNLLLIVGLLPSVVEFSLEKFVGLEIVIFKVLSSLFLGGIVGVVLSHQIIDMFSSKGKIF